MSQLPDRTKMDPANVCYVDTDAGVDDISADGSEEKPYKSLAYAYIQRYDNPAKLLYLTRASATDPVVLGDRSAKLGWKEPPKSAVKKADSAIKAHKKKLEKQAAMAAEKEKLKEQRRKNLEEAKKVVIHEDQSLPPAVKINLGMKDVKLGDEKERGARVKVMGRIHRLRQQKHATFITLVDGKGHLQCVIPAGDLTKTYHALTFALGTSLELYGEMKKVPAGHSASDDRELAVDFYRVIGAAPTEEDSMTNKVSAQQNQWDHDMLNSRHLVLRGDNACSLMTLRQAVELAFIDNYRKMQFKKVSPPALVQTQCEGGATLFSLPYYDETAYLTQSSQLYLETCLPSMGDVYCIEKSFRAEKSLTRRHLSEYTHIEAEMDFIEFSDLLDHLEELLCNVIDAILEDPISAAIVESLNPTFAKPSRPFTRIRYSEAIKWLNAQDPPILNEEGKTHVFGDDIAEAAERHMTDTINKPILLTHFPTDLKAFYMQKDPSDREVTESVDLLMPGVGEILGGSMRMYDYDELLEAYHRKGIDPKDYYWYTDQRKYVPGFSILFSSLV